ncbi:hypothetical protein HMPREF0023_1577 [Acinetobacter sp. ATCC 27244]|nr:hypothetical protein HMPREF0023_1577 [Acinetobacter sp. ATCC 27244]
MQTIILDTETHTLNGLPIEIAYAPIEIESGKLSLDKKKFLISYTKSVNRYPLQQWLFIIF